jgi:predicted cupin superfamily sugar epimerase
MRRASFAHWTCARIRMAGTKGRLFATRRRVAGVAMATVTLFLLAAGERSLWHRVDAVEV